MNTDESLIMFQKSFLSIFVGIILPAEAIIYAPGTFDADRHNRFEDNAAFVGSGFDFSGVGHYNIGVNANRQWLTMLSDRVFITASHTGASSGLTTTFYTGNDATATPVTNTIAEVMRIGNTDITIGRLTTALPSSIKTYDFTTQSLDSFGFFFDTNINGQNAFINGLENNGAGSTTGLATNHGVGRNLISGFQEDSSFTLGATTYTTDTIFTNQDSSGSFDFVTDEAYAGTSGDSGAPVFIVDNGDLLLVGTNSFATSAPAGGAAYTGNYANDIQNYIDATVPEPSSALFCLPRLFRYL